MRTSIRRALVFGSTRNTQLVVKSSVDYEALVNSVKTTCVFTRTLSFISKGHFQLDYLFHAFNWKQERN